MADLDFTSAMIGTEQPDTLGEFYATVLGRPADMKEQGMYGWRFSSTFLSIVQHSEVKGRAAEPQRVILNLQTPDVQEPYDFEGTMQVATFADPDGNYFQLMSPFEEPGS